MMRLLSFLAPAVAAFILANCAGVGFDSAWDKAVAEYEPGDSSGVTGPWTGSWLSHHNAHTGDLRCLVTREPGSEDLHRFRYHATWGKFFRGGFRAKFPVEPDGNGYLIKGDQSLGPFGNFNHDGRVDGDNFNATFGSAKGDFGVFEMMRPQ